MDTGPFSARRWAARSAVVLGLTPALLVAGCFGTKSPSEHAADYARAIASTDGLTVASVTCAPLGEVHFTCTGLLRSGRPFTCTVAPVGRGGNGFGSCAASARKP